MELKDIVQPKWVLSTKRGVGMLLTFLTTLLPFLSGWAATKGVHIDAPMVALFGQVIGGVIDAVGTLVGFGLMIWGMWRPTAPLAALPPKEEPKA
jgi:hypothetical protein